MKDLERIIKENKENFDTFEPDNGHFERFQNKINGKNNRRFDVSLSLYLKMASVAAILIIAILVSFKYYRENYAKPVQQQKSIALGDVSPEYKEVELYLKSNVDQKLNEFENLSCSKQDDQIKTVLDELKELDQTYQELQKELENNENDQRIIDAMIDCYQNKIELLNQVISQVNKNC
jgi:hypothetical protein